jgi:hypothetical protein
MPERERALRVGVDDEAAMAGGVGYVDYDAAYKKVLGKEGLIGQQRLDHPSEPSASPGASPGISPDTAYRLNYSATMNPGMGPATDFGTTGATSNQQTVGTTQPEAPNRRAGSAHGRNGRRFRRAKVDQQNARFWRAAMLKWRFVSVAGHALLARR